MFGSRIGRSLAIARESYSVLKANPSLGFFPLISGIATFIASIPFLAVLGFTYLGHPQAHPHFGPLHYAVTGVMYFVNMFIIVFFNSALVACANENLQGRPATMSFGIQHAISRLPQIFCWALIASTVGMVLRLVTERVGAVGQLVSAVLGLAWNLVVFFVVPVLVLEKVSPIEAIKSSSKLLKSTWGDRVIGGFGISSVLALLGLLVFIPISLGVVLLINKMYPLAIFLFIASAMYILVLAIVGSALGTIFQTALYLYCRNGVIPGGFAPSSMQNAFQPKPEKTAFGRRF